MQITRQRGIFPPITFDTEKADYEARLNFNKLAFISEILIEIIDNLKETNQYRHGLKKALNDALREAEKVVGLQVMAYENHGNVDNDGNEIHSLNVYTITSRAYDEAFRMFSERNPGEIVSIMELVRRFEEKGGKLEDVKIEYKPVAV